LLLKESATAEEEEEERNKQTKQNILLFECTATFTILKASG
jgi:hypothetical protein